ncbi:undecaprenyldiphospho-muramoylpentapeptide beta-N-acetylglucosaminyltransferase [Polynucleobacter asymbioticus]|uniref:UDP-N-acetylglucosamine--N-acetylmuramyl-(pentapeptide) pyrophosphoryl-undecaprenol N-acetylglucosamine transferase n=1 Tax=Polynucleobacter asymbioticus (strain DSM 18221 / CIP 109841 / QLW-P1DMWA-1) TaxID=312153 RepID=MURG_POLAQ|nr:undecaprenyldiphospho-muramoylpentapeptide beta-N-acetylglucosaminyltransferase [Polynucleobacter asymbioticus]A4SV74.1 RecName: Full=UDP-N-acetylglucosamine--N-acetylmuramyl-(pentapeptide) pyrophosphoryl-undecaprenol N-acetylglucosamine transferase; AltName: Full=Undecaprenyl-PP-MurNAc-pentapeptide-UDPGlcNAc GlcNAc transferase [Polynucleobacter asymbioticus QLW-P1DMWA-1]ABP33388.1 UDP-N-acetylglucosamine--N-acetylmuramyl-(pentapeptide) pyrophosphoryl-undecaprenol N-acetylglucosamine transfera
MTKPSILVMAGGTGGHIFPGLAVAEYLRICGWNVSWLGNQSGMEYRLVKSCNFPFEAVEFGGLRGKGIKAKLMLPINLARACHQSWKIMRRLKPNVVLGMGGYITFPGGLISKLLKRPLVLHEANSVAGSANRALAKIAMRTLTGFPNTMENAEWVGNPIRQEFDDIAAPAERYEQRQGPLSLLVVGGSLGAAALNENIPAALALIPLEQRPTVIHQAGDKHLLDLQKRYADLGVLADIRPFIEDMPTAYAQADLVICRSGAMTVSELAACGVASCLIPFPHAIDDHQTANAQFLSDADAAVFLPQKNLNPQDLALMIQNLTRTDLKEMAVRAHALSKPHATQRVAEVCADCAGVGI